MSLLKMISNGKTQFTKTISKMEEHGLVISNFKVQYQYCFWTIDKRKNDHNCHLASKWNNPGLSSKTYWSILKSFYSGKKVPLVPSLLHNN